MNFVRAINEIHTNIWAIAVLLGGVILYCCHKPDVGSGLIGGGFALMRASAPSSQGSSVVAAVTN